MDVAELKEWLDGIGENLSGKQQAIATEILKEIRSRLSFLLDVGLDYLSLDRTAMTLRAARVSASDSPRKSVRSW